jgi:hypothetical protein
VRSILVDAGPLIAFQDRSDRYHRRMHHCYGWPGILEILTIDLRDFAAYRLSGNKALRPVI